MDVTIKIGDKDVLATGTFVVPEKDLDVSLKIADLEFVFKFVEDEADPELKIVGSRTGEKQLQLSIRNVINPLGTIWTANVGQINKRRLALSISVHGIPSGKHPRLIGYTFTLGEAVDE